MHYRFDTQGVSIDTGNNWVSIDTLGYRSISGNDAASFRYARRIERQRGFNWVSIDTLVWWLKTLGHPEHIKGWDGHCAVTSDILYSQEPKYFLSLHLSVLELFFITQEHSKIVRVKDLPFGFQASSKARSSSFGHPISCVRLQRATSCLATLVRFDSDHSTLQEVVFEFLLSGFCLH